MCACFVSTHYICALYTHAVAMHDAHTLGPCIKSRYCIYGLCHVMHHWAWTLLIMVYIPHAILVYMPHAHLITVAPLPQHSI